MQPQLAVRDKLIQRQQHVLNEHGLDGKVRISTFYPAPISALSKPLSKPLSQPYLSP